MVKPKLLTLPWFARLWNWFVAVRSKTMGADPPCVKRVPGAGSRPSQVLPQALEERVPYLALGGFRPVFDLGQ